MIIGKYIIMSGDIAVMEWHDGEITVLSKRLLPLFFERSSNLETWLETRAIDAHRPNSRLLKKALRLTEYDDAEIALSVHAVTITDNYWVRRPDEDLQYDEVRYQREMFPRLALEGAYQSFNHAANLTNRAHSVGSIDNLAVPGSSVIMTPELTNTGSYEKCWRLKDGRWWMYKRATHNELFSELFVCRLGQKLGLRMADYEKYDYHTIRTLDFTNGATVNFEPAFSFMGENEDYEDTLAELLKICPQAVPDYVRMIFLDTITANPDRHTFNFGLLRDTKSGEFLCLAPLFDHNMALIARGYQANPSSRDVLIRLMKEFLMAHPSFLEFLPKLTEEVVDEIIDDLGMKVRKAEVCQLVMQRYRLLIEGISENR